MLRSFTPWFPVVAVALTLVAGCSRTTTPSPDASAEAPTSDAARETLQGRIDKAVDFTYSKRRLNTKEHAAWQIVHGALCYGKDYEIRHDGKLTPAIEYLLKGGALTGWTMRKGDHGLEAVLEAGSKTGQGHEDQWLGYLSQCGLKTDEPIVVAGQTYTINDLITQAQWDIYPGMEATWTLMAFSTYFPLDTKWTSKDGTEWTIEKMVEMEARQDLNVSACGGSHRLYGLTVALNRYKKEGGELTGGWAEADKTIRTSAAKAKEYQQPDGGFSTNFFMRPSTSDDIALRISTTGHILEFLAIALDDEEVRQPWVTRAAEYLVGALEGTQDFPLECGSLYHAVHGLILYRQRLYGDRPIVAQAALEGAAAQPDAKDNAGN